MHSALPSLTLHNYTQHIRLIQTIVTAPPVVVLFHAPWCGLCMPARVVFAEAAPHLHAHASSFEYNTDGGLPDPVASLVTSLPMVLVYRGGIQDPITLSVRHFTVKRLRKAVLAVLNLN